jgi:hypothetical protein
MVLVTATGETAPIYGKITAKLKLGKIEKEQEILIANIDDDGILGEDFLKQENCDILFSRGCLIVKGEKIPLVQSLLNDTNFCCRIHLKENVNIPAETERIFWET